MIQLAASMGRNVDGEVFVDSSAALGVIDRKGNGKLRHIRVGQLWVQQAAEDEVLAYRKVHGKQNPADLCTKNLTQALMDAALSRMDMEIRAGRAQEGLELNKVKEKDQDWDRCSYGGRKVHWVDAIEEEEQQGKV